MILIKKANVYTPEYIGEKDVFLAGSEICRIDDQIDLPHNFDVEIIDGEGMNLFPGFIDSHVHVLGGGGEDGFSSRTPEINLSELTRHGVTTVVGCLGTDGIARELTSLIAKIKGLREQGISAYAYTGSYQVPVKTMTESIIKDIMMIEEFIGVGEIAISDHRSSQPTKDEFMRLSANARVGGMLSKTAGIINVHLGDSDRMLDLIEETVEETEIPVTQFLPTHVNRNAKLFERAIAYAKGGGTIDFTGNNEIDYWETVCDEVRVCRGIKRLLDEGVNSDQFTISSDGHGSFPMFDKEGKFIGMGMGESSCLIKEVKECVEKENIPVEIAIKAITANPAKILRLSKKGHIIEGFDADLCLLKKDFTVDTVIAKGKTMIKNGEVLVKGSFES